MRGRATAPAQATTAEEPPEARDRACRVTSPSGPLPPQPTLT
ncbi:hypothetical protein HMPREF9057_01127 [Actinomyces sp. oral taxon 171 str. F0337]|nr:hypothetical protein HMPREF9057_01127 [Actinomyces sp. oral taxon 171 str. F0337]